MAMIGSRYLSSCARTVISSAGKLGCWAYAGSAAERASSAVTPARRVEDTETPSKRVQRNEVGTVEFAAISGVPLSGLALAARRYLHEMSRFRSAPGLALLTLACSTSTPLPPPPKDLATFFADWRDFQRPKLVDGIPDYSATSMTA